MEEKKKKSIIVVAWDHVCTHKNLGGASILNLFQHMIACRFTFILFMFEGVQPWTKMAACFIKKIGSIHVNSLGMKVLVT